MKLTKRERDVICVSELLANKPAAELAELADCKDHTVRYQLRTLKERGVIGPSRPFVDVYSLGFTDYALYFSLATKERKAKAHLIEKLVNTEPLPWITELGGEYQYMLALYAKNVSDVLNLLNDLFVSFGNSLVAKSLIVRTFYARIGRAYLAPDIPPGPPLSYSASSEAVAVDDLDREILNSLSRADYRSLRELARMINIPSTTLERRIKNLEEQGVVKGYAYRIKSSAYGMQMFKLLVEVRGINTELRNRLYDFAMREANIVFFIECLGKWDYELGAEVEQARDVAALRDLLYEEFADDITQITVLPVFGYLKYDNYPFQAG